MRRKRAQDRCLSNLQSAAGLSVIIPYAGSPTIHETMTSLRAQTLPRSRYAIFVVTESCCSTELARNLSKNQLREITVLTYSRPNGFLGHTAGILRNMGANAAIAEFLLFVDSDCILGPRCLEEHLKALQGSNQLVNCGAWYELPVHRQRMLQQQRPYEFAKLLKHSYPDFRARRAIEPSWENLYSGNVSIPKGLFNAVNGFDEQGYRCHDLDLGYRLWRAGADIRFNRKCSAIHLEHPRSITTCLEQAAGFLNLADRHPEIRAHAEDRALVLRRKFERLTAACEEAFSRITAELPGIRNGTAWHLPVSFSPARLRKALEGYSFLVETHAYHRRYVLRVDRDCWDFSVVHPRKVALQKPLVCVVIPTCNSSEFLERALASVLGQTMQGFEIILVDDASTDTTEVIARTYAIDSRIRFLFNSVNRGLAFSLNRGLHTAHASILVHLDPDDWLEPNALAEVVRVFQEEPDTGAVYGAAIRHVGGKTTFERGFQIRSAREFFEYEPMQVPRAYRRELLFRVGGWSTDDAYDGRFYEDRLTLARVHHVSKVRFIDKHLYHVSVRRESLTRGDPLQASVAKALIRCAFGNSRRWGIEVRYRKGLLHAELTPPRELSNRRGWTVVIPAYGREGTLRYALRSWAESAGFRSGPKVQIILVDDGSPVPLERVAREISSDIQCIRLKSRRGPAVARNVGAEAARHEMLFFSDSDRIVPPDVLAVHEAKHEDLGSAIVIGGQFGRKVCTNFEPSSLRNDLLAKIIDRFRFSSRECFEVLEAALFGETVDLLKGARGRIWKASQRLSLADAYLAKWAPVLARIEGNLNNQWQFLRVGGGSLSCKRALFEKLGRFDERIQPMEDWEFGVRAQKLGLQIVWAPEAETYHQVHSREPFFEARRRVAVRVFQRKHPQLLKRIREGAGDQEMPGIAFIRRSWGARGDSRGLSQERATLSAGDSFAPTFDDGPHRVGTPKILSALQRYGGHATFFMCGANAQRSRTLVKDVVDANCEIGVHGWDHAEVTAKTTKEIFTDLAKTISAVENVSGTTPRYCRPPFGIASASYLEAARELNLTVVGWDVSSRDWCSGDAAGILAELAIRGISNRVILFHDATGDLAAVGSAFAWLLERASKRNVTGVTLSAIAGHRPLPPVPIERMSPARVANGRWYR